jgi:excisionase family DNA binding protein
MDNPSTPAAAYSIMQVSARVGINKDAIYKAIKDGRLPARKLGKRTLILAADLEAFLQALPRMEAKHFVHPYPYLGGETA